MAGEGEAAGRDLLRSLGPTKRRPTVRDGRHAGGGAVTEPARPSARRRRPVGRRRSAARRSRASATARRRRPTRRAEPGRAGRRATGRPERRPSARRSSCRTRSSSRRARSATASSTATSSTSSGSARSAARARRSSRGSATRRRGSPRRRAGCSTRSGSRTRASTPSSRSTRATWAGWEVPVIVNVAGESIEDYVEVARRLDGVPGRGRHRAEHQLPERRQGGLQFAIDADAAGAVTAAVRRATDLPLLVKLSPNVADVRPIARASRTPAPTRSPRSTRCPGSPSAPTARPAAARQHLRRPVRPGDQAGRAAGRLRGRARSVDIPIVAIGGVTELADVLDFLAVGAVAVQVGTAIFADPTLPVRLVDELAGRVPAPRLRLVPDRSSARRCRRRPGAPSAKGVRVPAVTTLAARDEPPRPRRGRGAHRGAVPRLRARSREGHFQLKSGRHGDALPREVPGPPGSGRDQRAVRLLGRPGRGTRRRADGRPGRRPDDRRRHPGLRDRAASSASGASSPRRSAATTARRHREFRRGFRIEPGERVLLVDDILTTGGSLLAMLPAVEAIGGEIVECVVLVDRSGGLATLTSPATGRVYPLRALWRWTCRPTNPGPRPARAVPTGRRSYAPGSTGTPTPPDAGGPAGSQPVRARPGRGHRGDRRGAR